MNELRFDTKLETQPVILVVDGEERRYELRELLGRERDSFLNELQAQTNFINGRPAGLKDYRGMHAHLLTKVLFDPNGKSVPKEFVQGLPARITTALFKEAEKMNGLEQTEELEEKVKNG